MIKAVPIILLYLLTVPTNMVCLGAFTESWLKEFAISRQTLTYIYFTSTFFVFFSLKWIPYRCSLQTTLIFLSIIYLSACIGSHFFPFIFIISTTFFLLQYLGQGWCVQVCRIRLFQQIPLQYYSKAVGWMEALGTCMVFLLPFIFLWLLNTISWQYIFLGLAFLYALAANIIPANLNIITPIQKEKHKRQSFKFFGINLVVYLPVLTTSGLFFHLEGFCKKYTIDLPVLSFCTTIQIVGSIGFQIILGYLIGKKWYRLNRIYILQIFLQILWFWSLFNFQMLGRICYIFTGIISWGCFGLLVNVLWQYLYHTNLQKTILGFQESVRFGFLANALGPCIFYLLL